MIEVNHVEELELVVVNDIIHGIELLHEVLEVYDEIGLVMDDDELD